MSGTQPTMKARAWAMHRAGEPVQVWRASQAGGLERYDSEATRRMTDHIVKTRDALATMGGRAD
jgi:hypothetical protein